METIFENEDEVMYRFICDCSSPGCVMDVDVQKHTPFPDITLCWYGRAQGLGQRLQWAWAVLRHGKGVCDEFVTRPEDVADLAKVLSGRE